MTTICGSYLLGDFKLSRKLIPLLPLKEARRKAGTSSIEKCATSIACAAKISCSSDAMPCPGSSGADERHNSICNCAPAKNARLN